jgi:hypothetical protein
MDSDPHFLAFSFPPPVRSIKIWFLVYSLATLVLYIIQNRMLGNETFMAYFIVEEFT